jgi:predicted Fe-Mo cluster-binding NifX family protein
MAPSKKFRIAIATNERGGLEDTVSEVFGRANSFTIVDVEDDEIKSVEVIQNPAVSYKHGAGPIVVKMLVDSGVSMILATELGPGASALLEQHNVAKIAVKPGGGVSETVKNALVEIKKMK